MILPVLRAGSWPAVAGISGVAVVVGGCGMASPAIAPVLLTIAFTALRSWIGLIAALFLVLSA